MTFQYPAAHPAIYKNDIYTFKWPFRYVEMCSTTHTKKNERLWGHDSIQQE